MKPAKRTFIWNHCTGFSHGEQRERSFERRKTLRQDDDPAAEAYSGTFIAGVIERESLGQVSSAHIHVVLENLHPQLDVVIHFVDSLEVDVQPILPNRIVDLHQPVGAVSGVGARFETALHGDQSHDQRGVEAVLIALLDNHIEDMGKEGVPTTEEVLLEAEGHEVEFLLPHGRLNLQEPCLHALQFPLLVVVFPGHEDHSHQEDPGGDHGGYPTLFQRMNQTQHLFGE